jgi:hypothetical protein
VSPSAPLTAVLGLLFAIVVLLWTVLATVVLTAVCALGRAVETVHRRARS